jgi:thiamine-phosphate pyrophosphorylase
MKIDTTLYLVTDSTGKTNEEFLNIIEKACKGGITLLQLREKNRSGRDLLALAIQVRELADKYNVPLIIDDRVDIALASGAAGVHVGQSDIPVHYARELMGKYKIVGASAKTVEQAVEAYKQGADYLGAGAIYPTTTKVVTQITEVTTLNEICKSVPIPVVAIGGLNKDNMHILKDSPISGISVVSAIMKSDNPQQSAAELKKKIADMLA